MIAPSIYRVEHTTRYAYDSGVSTSHHVAWLEPRVLPYQDVSDFELLVDPAPARLVRRDDYFGNPVHQFQLLRPHGELTVTARSLVTVRDREIDLASMSAVTWENARPQIVSGRVPLDVVEHVFPSPLVAASPEIAAFARESFPGGGSLVGAAVDLMHRIHDGFTFDPGSTTPATPVTRVLEDRRGVCQDFAHFQIACLRSVGLAARYVSGYLLTDPPPGQPRLIGADASHAWLSVHVPGHGWLDLDPTNNVIVGQRHVTIGWGRDYGDVTPLRGVLLGGAQHRLFVGVSVVPVESTAA